MMCASCGKSDCFGPASTNTLQSGGTLPAVTRLTDFGFVAFALEGLSPHCRKAAPIGSGNDFSPCPSTKQMVFTRVARDLHDRVGDVLLAGVFQVLVVGAGGDHHAGSVGDVILPRHLGLACGSTTW